MSLAGLPGVKIIIKLNKRPSPTVKGGGRYHVMCLLCERDHIALGEKQELVLLGSAASGLVKASQYLLIDALGQLVARSLNLACEVFGHGVIEVVEVAPLVLGVSWIVPNLGNSTSHAVRDRASLGEIVQGVESLLLLDLDGLKLIVRQQGFVP